MQLKPISREGIPAALAKAERYRLLNDSPASESICLDILEVDAGNQQALITLLLSITDQFVASEAGDGVRRAREVLPRLTDEYKRSYYAGIIAERKAKAILHRGGMGVDEVAYAWFREAMRHYETAEALRPAGNDEAILRWNTCLRQLDKHAPRRPTSEELEPVLGE